MNDIDNIGMTGSSKMPHSHSTPAGVDGGSRTPPTTPRKAGKMLAVRVQMLDDTITMFQVQAKALGRVLFDQVCKQLHLLEADYFGLEYQEPNGTKYWLDLEKPVCRQVGLSLVDPLLRFCVKFYTPDPAQLEEEFTRYLFCLQIKRDLSHGLLQCNDNTAALMASYIVQAECGDYVIEDYPDHTYLSTYKFVPHQDQELERRIMENHKKHAGQSPAEADLNLLETSRRCELYGIKMHPAKDHEAVPLNLAVAHMGIVVFQNYTKINTFSWAKIRKISFKRKRFLIKLHPEGYGYYKDTVEFFFEGRNECKNFWKKCVENHGFFRCSVVKRVIRQKTRVLSRGSSFRYSGKTQKQIVEFVRDNYVKRQTFQRSNSFRQTSGGRALQGSEGGGYRGATPSSSLMGSSSISAHPLLPLGDPALGTPALSLSCGSMTLDSPTTVTSVSMGGTSHHRREDTAMSSRTLTSIDVHLPATPSQAHPGHRQMHQFAMSQHQPHRISSAGRISPSNSSPPEFPPPRPIPRHPWQRSASCRELYASSFEDSGKARTRDVDENKTSNDDGDGDDGSGVPVVGNNRAFELPSQGELDNPVTRYDTSNRSYSAASSKLPSLDHDSVPERVYSSSYPGTSSLSTESGHEESGQAGDLSHDDLSHDSYELLEREHEFEYPESYSSPRDDENEVISDNSDDEGIEHEMFQMDSETDSFVKHKSVRSSDKQIFKSVLADIKNTAVRAKSIDRYSVGGVGGGVKSNDANYIVTESRIQRTGTQIERKFETRHANSVDQSIGKPPLPHQDSGRKDPVVLQVQKQKLTVLNELKNLRPKHKMISHVDSEILRDEGIMRPKSRIDDDLSPSDPNRTIFEAPAARPRTVRARSIASLEDNDAMAAAASAASPRFHIETGSLGRSQPHSGDKRRRDDDFRFEKTFKFSLDKEARTSEQQRDERKRNEREARRIEKADSREKHSIGRVDSRERRSMERLDLYDSHHAASRGERRDIRRSAERLDSREKSSHEVKNNGVSGASDCRHEARVKSVENLDRSPKEKNASRYHEVRERRERSIERLDSRESRKSPGRGGHFDYEQRHTLERFDSAGGKSPRDRPSPRGKSVDKLVETTGPTFDFDPRTIERLSSLERRDSFEKTLERNRGDRRTGERRGSAKLDSSRKSLESLGRDDRSDETLETRDGRRARSHRVERSNTTEEKPRERDDWRSLERARKGDERRERERQSKLSLDMRTDTIIGVPNERETLRGKSVFAEYEPKIIGGIVVGFDDSVLSAHVPVERTKSDPNPGRPRIGSNSKRHMLMHQKSIDLTPADSGDEDPFSDGPNNPRRANPEIPYTLHKRHVMNGTASDEKSESDSGKATTKSVKTKDLPKLPLKMVTDVSCLDLTKLTPAPAPKISPERPKSILVSPDKSKRTARMVTSPSVTLSPTDSKTPVSLFSPGDESPVKKITKDRSPVKTMSLDRYATTPTVCPPSKTCTKSSSLEKKSSKLSSPTEPSVTIISLIDAQLSPKLSPTEPSVTIVSLVEKSRSPDANSRSSGSERSPMKIKAATNLVDVVSAEIKKELERRENERLKVPDGSLEKQDSIEKIPLPEIPVKSVTKEKPPLPIRVSSMEKRTSTEKPALPAKPALPSKENLSIKLADQAALVATREVEAKKSLEGHSSSTKAALGESPKISEKPKIPEKPSIPEKTKRILDRIESRFSEINKNSPTKVSRPRIIDTGYDDFVDPVADLPLDEIPVKPALELDSLKVPDFNPYMLRPHAEPLRSKSLSLAEEKAPIDTLLSPEVENKVFVQQTDVSPKRSKKPKSDGAKKDFKKQSKSLEGDKPPLKKSASKESRISPASSKIDKSKLKLGEMPQEIIIIDSTDVAPEVSIIQKGRSKSVTRLPDRSFSGSKEEKDEAKQKPRAKSASVDDDMIKGIAAIKGEKQRPRSLGISKSLGSTDKESGDKVSPKKIRMKSDVAKPDVAKSTTPKASPSRALKNASQSEVAIVDAAIVKKSSVSRESSVPMIPEVEQSEALLSMTDDASRTIPKTAKSPASVRKSARNAAIFERSRLGLSEGSAIGPLQRQGATLSPTAQRRAKSLDAPIISVHKLPAANAFSSKDDTVDTLEESSENENVENEAQPPEYKQQQHQQQHSLQMEVSPNHRSDSTDHTTVPEIFTDSLSMTETSAQYLESPLTECQEITACPDLIPYEHDAQLQQLSANRSIGRESNIEIGTGPKIEGATRFIDQSSVESGAETDAMQDTSADIKTSTGGSDYSSKSPIVVRSSKNDTERSRVEISSDSSDDEMKRDSTKMIASATTLPAIDTDIRDTVDREELPNVTVRTVVETVVCPVELVYLDTEDTPDMVKSPIQISIEECSDAEAPVSDEIHDDILDQAIFQAKQTEKPRLDSGDTSEDTLDALDAQTIHTQTIDSDLSSPDYGPDKLDEKTLVEVELTPEYLEMRRDDEEAAEELPEDDEPSKDRSKDITERDAKRHVEDETTTLTTPNQLNVEKKARLSTERSRSEETNTWTPDREDPDSSSCSIARPLGIGQIQPIFDRREIAMIKESRREASVEEESNGSQAVARPPEMSSTWKPFPLESSGSSSLDDGWLPQDDPNHHQSHSEDSNNGQNEDSFQEDLDFPTGLVYPINPDMIANYGAFALSRTLSRISERSTTSEQDKSDLEDSFKPSSRSPSLDDESLISSDHQPSLSSDPPSGTALPSVSDDRRTSSELPDIPIDVPGHQDDENKSPRSRKSRLQAQASEDWPSPPSSPIFDKPPASHVETYYMEIKPEEAVRVTITESTPDDTPGRAEDSDVDDDEDDSSDENRTLHDDLHSTLMEDGQSSASATTIDGTVKIAVKPKSNSYITGSSHSEDTSMGLSMSEWSSSNNTVRQFCQYSGTKSDDNSLAELGASISDWSGSTTVIPQQYYSAVAAEKSQSDTTTSDKSITSMRPNSKCQLVDSPNRSGADDRGAAIIETIKARIYDAVADEADDDDDDDDEDGNANEADSTRYSRRHVDQQPIDDRHRASDEFAEARKFVESQFDAHHHNRRRYEEIGSDQCINYTDISPPRITFQNEYDETVDEEDMDEYAGPLPSIPGPIPEEDEDDQLYDNVPAMRYTSVDQVRMKVSQGHSSEDMHERYADLASRSRPGEEEWSFDEQHRRGEQRFSKHNRGYPESGQEERYVTRSTERPVVVTTRAKSTPYYSTTSLSGESTTSSPPMQVRAQIRTKTMPYSSCRSPQSEGDTSSSMDSPGHTPDRGQRAYRRKSQQNAKRRHRVAVDLEVRDGHVISSTDSSFDVTSLPPPLLAEPSIDIADEDEPQFRHEAERH